MLTCPDCGKELLGDEIVCPHCLARLPRVAPAPMPPDVPPPSPSAQSPLPTNGAAGKSASSPPLAQRIGGFFRRPARKPAEPSLLAPTAGRYDASPTTRSRPSRRATVLRAITLTTAGLALLLIGFLLGQVSTAPQATRPAPSSFEQGMTLYRQQRYAAAAYLFAVAADAELGQPAKAAPALTMLGWSHYRLGDYSTALEAFLAATGLDADYADAYVGLGFAYLAQDEAALAEQNFNEALSLNTDLAPAHRGLGLLHLQANRRDLALAELGRAAELAPDDSDNHAALGLALRAAGRHLDAINALERAVAGDPAAPVLDALIEEYWAVGRYDDAVSVARGRMDLQPQNAFWRYMYGMALWRAGQPENARAAFQKTLELKPPAPLAGDANRMIGVTLAQQERYQDALEPLSRAIALRPDDALALTERGWALARIGRCADSLSDFQRARRVQPDLRAAIEGENACQQWLKQQ